MDPRTLLAYGLIALLVAGAAVLAFRVRQRSRERDRIMRGRPRKNRKLDW